MHLRDCHYVCLSAIQSKTCVLAVYGNYIHHFLLLHFVFSYQNCLINISQVVHTMSTSYYSSNVLKESHYRFTVHIKQVGRRHPALSYTVFNGFESYQLIFNSGCFLLPIQIPNFFSNPFVLKLSKLSRTGETPCIVF